MTIEPARAEHAAAMAELWERLGYATSAGDLERRLSGFDTALHLTRVAVSEGDVVGFVHVFRSDRLDEEPFAELGGVIVAEAFRDRGVGRRLMRSAERWAQRSGCALLRVRSRADRGEAHRFYERVGYRRTKRQQVLEKELRRGTPGHRRSSEEGRE
ncbi:MAG: GNAT family N-acetyltransferase [Thermoanaerobaculia bacterium]|nr:GNAT family N-acetyltransferase [Thermoanaerobaculia bacterium]